MWPNLQKTADLVTLTEENFIFVQRLPQGSWIFFAFIKIVLIVGLPTDF